MTTRLPKHLFDARAAAMLAREFCAGIGLADYRASVLLRSAVDRQLEILGEAARRSLIEALDSELSAYPLPPGNG